MTALFTAVLAIVLALTVVPAASAATDTDTGLSEEAAGALAAQAAEMPGGIVEGNTITYPDGSYFVALDAETFSLSECSSGYFCGWAQSNFSGSFFAVSGSGVTKSLSWSTRSYWNRRSAIARLYNNTATASTCFAVNESRATIDSSYYAPDKVTLSTSTSC